MQCHGRMLLRPRLSRQFEVIVGLLLARHINVTSALQLKSADSIVRKFLINNNESKKRKKFYQNKMLPNPANLAQPQMKGEKNSHRLQVLNKVFMDKICDLLSTGNISSLFTGYGLEISKVRVLPSMGGINVHWYCTGSDLDNKLENILNENSYLLRDELSQQRVIGRVPPISFVKDHRYYRLMEVERRLAVADFGEGFEPTDSTHQIKSLIWNTEFDNRTESPLEMSMDREGCDFFHRAFQLSSQLSEIEEQPDELPLDLPPMKNAVFGVDTHKIFLTVKQHVTRARAGHRRNPRELPQGNAFVQGEMGIQNFISRTEEIRQWAHKYETLRKKERRSKIKDEEWLTSPHTYNDDHIEDVINEEEEDYWNENELDISV